MKKMLEKLDMYSMPITLRYNNKEYFQTQGGGICTLVSFLVIIVIIIVRSGSVIEILPHFEEVRQILMPF